MNWITTHKKKAIALLGLLSLWVGLIMLSSLPTILICTGLALIVGAGISAIPEDF